MKNYYAQHESSASEYTKYICVHNMVTSLAKIGEIDEALELLESSPLGEKDPFMLTNIAVGYSDLGEYEKAIRYGLCSAQLFEDDKTYLVLGEAYLALCNYKKSEKMLLKSINHINNEKGKPMEQLNNLGLMTNTYSKEERINPIYNYLIQAYVGNEEYEYAEAALIKMRETGGKPESIIASNTLINISNKVENKKHEVEEAYAKLTEKLNKTEEKVTKLKQEMSQWYDKLVKCQIWGDKEVPDDIWEDQISEKMNDVITTLSNFCIQKSSRSYNEVMNSINKRFPKLSKGARNFLATAEQIYKTFEEEEMMDFAPVLVEYARFVETMLWQYLDNSPEYKEEAEKNKAYNNQGSTLGAATYTIGLNDKPLKKYYEKVRWIKEQRNNSAHINVSREPEVREVRDYIWDSDFIDSLCEKPWES